MVSPLGNLWINNGILISIGAVTKYSTKPSVFFNEG
jgi:hypothetical protein